MNRYLEKLAAFGIEPATLKAAVGLGGAAVGAGVLKSHLKNRSDERRQARSDTASISRTLVGRLSSEEAAKKLAPKSNSPD